MALASPARSALSNLPINSFGTPSIATPLGEPMPRKRRIDEVDEPENVPVVHKAFLSRSAATKNAVIVRESGAEEKSASHEDSTLTVVDFTPKDPKAEDAIDPEVVMEDAPSPRSSTSSTVDGDPDETMESQQTAATEFTQPLAHVAPPPGLSRVSQQAEMLRLRLQLAQFKVRTNQTNVPFSQLRTSSSPTAQLREPAQQQRCSDDAEPLLPRLLPGANFSRSDGPVSHMRGQVVPAQDPSSSPRRSESPGREEEFRTPALPRHTQMRGSGQEEESLTSSVIRGKAAIGLLGLRGDR